MLDRPDPYFSEGAGGARLLSGRVDDEKLILTDFPPSCFML